jgi:predicted Zn-dependent protease
MMREHFYSCANALDGLIRDGETYLAWFEGEASDFLRFNRAAIRQAGRVTQQYLDLRLIRGARHASARITLSRDALTDDASLAAIVDQLRQELPALPEDPYLLYATEARQVERLRHGRIAGTEEVVSEILDAAGSLDLVGIYAAGPICRGFASSLGSRCWHETQSFNFDFSLHLDRDRAVKTTYAGFDWDPAALRARLDGGRSQLELMRGPARSLSPGRYRTYLAPAAVAEIMETLAWDGFGIKALRTKQSPLTRLAEGAAALGSGVSLAENSAGGIAADFQQDGFAKPDRVSLVSKGRMDSALVCPRSAREFGVATNGANSREGPESIDMAAGELAVSDVLYELNTGIFVNNLWYLNYSDRPAGRITGMTRFASFWVENGTIVAPINVMRFDESLYRMLGSNLLGLTQEREIIIDAQSYGARSIVSQHLPGALIGDFTLTL